MVRVYSSIDSSLAYKSCMVTPVLPPLQRPPLLPCPSLHHPGQSGRVLEGIDVPLRQHSLSVSIDEGRSQAPPLASVTCYTLVCIDSVYVFNHRAILAEWFKGTDSKNDALVFGKLIHAGRWKYTGRGNETNSTAPPTHLP